MPASAHNRKRFDRIPVLQLPESILSHAIHRKDGRRYTVRSFPKLRFATEVILTLVAARHLDQPEHERDEGVPIHRDEFLAHGVARDSFFPALQILIAHGAVKEAKRPFGIREANSYSVRWYALTMPESEIEIADTRFIDETILGCAPTPPPGWKLDTRLASRIIAKGVKDGSITKVSAWYGRRRISGSYYESQSEYGRVFTQYNGILKECRNAIRFQGMPTAEVDIANSQMVCLALLLRQKGLTSRDSNRFVALAEAGRSYETFADWLNRRGYMTIAKELTKESRKPGDESDRSTAKAIWNEAIFGKSTTHAHIAWFWDFLREEFPSVTDFILSTKKGKTGKDARAALSRALQTVEADIVMPICHDLNAVSIHDGIRCPIKLIPEVTERLHAAFKACGVSVTLKTEPA